MNRVLNHVRHNVIAYLALFVALGGTSYAAISVPNNSVGAAQIRNHSITPVKFNSKSIAASISAWVILQWKGSHIAATASSSHVVVRSSNEAESITWPHRHFARNCMASATPQVNLTSSATNLYGSVTISFDQKSTGGAFLAIHGFSPSGTAMAQAATVLVICP